MALASAGTSMALAGPSPRRKHYTEYHHEGTKWAGAGQAGLGECGPELDNIGRGIRAPRLSRELRILKAFDVDIHDWRKLEPGEILRRFHEVVDPEGRSLLGTAVFVGTAQAVLKHSYWAPSYSCPGATEVDCSHLVRPISCLHPLDKSPRPDFLQARGQRLSLTCMGRCSVLDAAAVLCSSAANRHVAVVRFTGVRDARNRSIRYGHPREDQLFLRTSYFKAFELMEHDINSPINEAIDQGGIVYTAGVGLLRGCLDEGALWFREPPKVDVLWIGLPARPHLAEQEQYADEQDRHTVGRAIGRCFAWAAAHGCDALVLPPMGCGTHSCAHPSLDVADLIHNTAHQYAAYIPQVVVASDYPAHFEGNWWEDFSAAVERGRPHLEARQLVPPIGLPPCLAPKKEKVELLQKTRRLAAAGSLVSPGRSWSTPRSGRFRHSFL